MQKRAKEECMYEFRQYLPYLLSLVEEESFEKVRLSERQSQLLISSGAALEAHLASMRGAPKLFTCSYLPPWHASALPNAHRLRFAGRK